MARKVCKDYKSAFERLVAKIRFESELWDEESKMDLNYSLQFRHEGMHSLCEHLLERAETYAAECDGKVNENGRVSLHLVNLVTGACVYDLDCNPSEVPARVWLEMLISEDGNTVQVSSQLDHIHQMRMHEWYGFKLTAIWDIVYPYVWRDDSDKTVDYGPDVWMAQYRDTAFAAC